MTRYYGYDGQGSVRFLTDAGGWVTDTYEYDAYGLLLTRSGSTANNYLYRGQQYDPDLGLYYLRARYYNPATGRFWTADPFNGFLDEPDGLNKYVYAKGNPAGNADPSGYWSFTVFGLQQEFTLWQQVRERVRDQWSAADEANGLFSFNNGGQFAVALERRAREKVHRGWVGTAPDGTVIGSLMGEAALPDKYTDRGAPWGGGGPGDHLFFALGTGEEFASKVERDVEQSQLAMSSLWQRLNTDSHLDEFNYWPESHYHAAMFKALHLGGDPMQEELGFEVYPSYANRGPGVMRADNGWAAAAQGMRYLRPRMAENAGGSFHWAILDRKINAYSEFAAWTSDELSRFQRDAGLLLTLHQIYWASMTGWGGRIGLTTSYAEQAGEAAGQAAEGDWSGVESLIPGIGEAQLLASHIEDETVEFGGAWGGMLESEMADCADALICFVAGTQVVVREDEESGAAAGAGVGTGTGAGGLGNAAPGGAAALRAPRVDGVDEVDRVDRVDRVDTADNAVGRVNTADQFVSQVRPAGRALGEGAVGAEAALRPIEKVRVGDQVWAKCDRTGQTGWKPVRHLFVTHPDKLIHLKYRHAGREARTQARALKNGTGAASGSRAGSGGANGVGEDGGESGDGDRGDDGDADGAGSADGDGSGDDDDSGVADRGPCSSESLEDASGPIHELIGTAPHPFWSLDHKAWVPMGDLRPGDHLQLLNGTPAVVESVEIEHAPPGQTFTTYNFEVADWHTYFVAEVGAEAVMAVSEAADEAVWVHNRKLRVKLGCAGVRKIKRPKLKPRKSAPVAPNWALVKYDPSFALNQKGIPGRMHSIRTGKLSRKEAIAGGGGGAFHAAGVIARLETAMMKEPDIAEDYKEREQCAYSSRNLPHSET